MHHARIRRKGAVGSVGSAWIAFVRVVHLHHERALLLLCVMTAYRNSFTCNKIVQALCS